MESIPLCSSVNTTSHFFAFSKFDVDSFLLRFSASTNSLCLAATYTIPCDFSGQRWSVEIHQCFPMLPTSGMAAQLWAAGWSISVMKAYGPWVENTCQSVEDMGYGQMWLSSAKVMHYITLWLLHYIVNFLALYVYILLFDLFIDSMFLHFEGLSKMTRLVVSAVLKELQHMLNTHWPVLYSVFRFLLATFRLHNWQNI